MVARALAILVALSAGAAQAQSPDALAWLRKIYEATQKLSYSGTFVYQSGERTQTSRITRFVDASGDIEKLEVLDGAPREIVRTRNSVRCYLPDSKVVKVERRSGARDFPALLPAQVTALAEHYELSLGESRRVSGYDCRAVVLAPRDNLRYGYRLYADAASGMLLKVVTVDPAGQDIEQIMFTQLRLGHVNREMVRPRHIAGSWRIEDAAAAPAILEGWSLSEELPGFKKVVELRRRLESKAVGQVVYSDGLAAVSVFIEPLDGRSPRTGLASMGAINIYTREVANHKVTVVGEAPALSVQRIADSVEYRQPR
jgi:sigma-E factor negative regulatory protein RseB